MSQSSLPDDYVPLSSGNSSTAQMPDDFVPIVPSGDTINTPPLRTPNTMDYVLPTAVSRLLQGSPAQFGGGLNSTNVWGDLNRPAQGVRQAVLDATQGKNPISGFQQGYTNPDQTSQTGIQDALLKTAPQTKSVLTNFIGGLPQSTVGVIGDTMAGLANPANALASLLIPGAAKSSVGQFSPDQFVLKKGSTLLDHLLGKDIQAKYVPEMEKIYQYRVDSFTPQVQELATKTLGVPQEVVDHIAQRTPQVVTAAAQGAGNDPALIQQSLEQGLAKKDAAVSQAYKSSIGAAPPNSVIQLPKATQAAQDYLTNKGIIDANGNLTGSGTTRISSPIANDNSVAVDRGIYAKWQQLKEMNNQATPSQWLDLRNGLSGIRKMADYEAPATNLLDALHEDVGDAGFNVQAARELAAKQFEAEKLAKPFVSMSGENQFAKPFNLNTKQLKNLQAVGDYVGQPLAEQAKNVQAADILNNKIRRYGTSYVGSPSVINNVVEKIGGVSPFPSAFAQRIKAEGALHELLGKNKDVTSLLSSLNNRKLLIGAGVGYTGYKLRGRLGLGEN